MKIITRNQSQSCGTRGSLVVLVLALQISYLDDLIMLNLCKSRALWRCDDSDQLRQLNDTRDITWTIYGRRHLKTWKIYKIWRSNNHMHIRIFRGLQLAQPVWRLQSKQRSWSGSLAWHTLDEEQRGCIRCEL